MWKVPGWGLQEEASILAGSRCQSRKALARQQKNRGKATAAWHTWGQAPKDEQNAATPPKMSRMLQPVPGSWQARAPQAGLGRAKQAQALQAGRAQLTSPALQASLSTVGRQARVTLATQAGTKAEQNWYQYKVRQASPAGKPDLGPRWHTVTLATQAGTQSRAKLIPVQSVNGI